MRRGSTAAKPVLGDICRQPSPRPLPLESTYRPNLRCINHDDLPNIYGDFLAGTLPLLYHYFTIGVVALLLSRSSATRVATCWLAVIAVSGCSSPNVVGPTVASLSKSRAEQTGSLDALAYDRPDGPTAISLPSPASQAIPVTEGGNGRMIGASPLRQTAVNSDSNVVLNLSSVPLQQAAKTVLGDMIGVNYVVDPRVDGVISVQTTQPVSKPDALELFQAALAPVGAALVENRGIYRIVPADQAATGTESSCGGTSGRASVNVLR